MKVLVILNPQAANGRARSLAAKLEALFLGHGVTADLRLSSGPQDAVEMVRMADLAVYDGVVAAGGDGTAFEVVNGYMANIGTSKPPLGVLPIGTGNSFARDIDLKTGDVDKAIALVAAADTRRIDVGRFTINDGSYHFLNILGLGFASNVTARARRLKLLGNVSYAVAVVLETIFLRTNRMILDVDGQRLERDSVFCEISNTRYTANFLMAPAARLDDGLLDITLLRGVSRRRLLTAFPKVFSGEHVHLPEVETLTARRIRIDSDEKMILTPDGEVLGHSPVDVECIPGALDVFADPGPDRASRGACAAEAGRAE